MLSQSKYIINIMLIVALILLGSAGIYAGEVNSTEVSNNTEEISDTEELDSGLKDYEEIAENEYLSLYINKSTTEIAVQKKGNGEIWFSNPQDLDSMENRARGAKKDALRSQLSIRYYNASDRVFEMDSYNDAILNDQFQITEIPNGVRVDFEFGKKWEKEDYMPTIIDKEKFENEVLANLSEFDQEFILNQYHLITLTEIEEDKEHLQIYGVNMDTLLGDYDIKVISENISDKDRRLLFQGYLTEIRDAKEYTGLGSIKHEDVAPLINNPTYILKSDILPWDYDGIIETFQKAGYTPSQIQEDHNQFNFTPPYANIENFKLSLEYILDEGDLMVRVPGDSMEYPSNVIDHITGDRVTLNLSSVSVLPYFEAANIEKEGFMLIPDGSGAIVYLNNNKADITPYQKRVYGRDYSVEPIRELAPYLEQDIYMPVYGLSTGNKGFLAIIEKGDSLARINAAVAGMRDSYNKIYSSFDIIPNTQVNLGGDLDHLSINMYQSRNYNRDIIVRYKLLDGEEIDYSNMALVYQDYLVDKYELTAIETDQDIPFFLEIMGGINKRLPIMGVPRNVIKPLTTYQQAADMISQLNNQGINDLAVLYKGWSTGGVYHDYPDKVRLEGSLGHKNDFNELTGLIDELNIDFYPEISFLNVYENKLLDGFSVYQDNARFLNRRYAFIHDKFWIDTYIADRDEMKWILSPGSLNGLVDDFISSYKNYDINGLSIRYMGQQINSDFRTNVNELIDREHSKDIIVDQLSKLSQDIGYNLTLRGGNAFTLPYIDYIIDMPLYSGSDLLIDQGIPFYQMAVHGYMHYSGQAINLAEKPEAHILKIIETGSIPYYRWAYGNVEDVQQSEFRDQFSINYQDYIEEAVAFYKDINPVMSELQNKRIIKHERLADNVYRVIYENGYSFIVNYNQEAVEIDGFPVGGLDYKFIKGEI
ncbi:MAG: DUF5696 domain-containing protein [Halanaerobiales bacterium]